GSERLIPPIACPVRLRQPQLGPDPIARLTHRADSGGTALYQGKPAFPRTWIGQQTLSAPGPAKGGLLGDLLTEVGIPASGLLPTLAGLLKFTVEAQLIGLAFKPPGSLTRRGL